LLPDGQTLLYTLRYGPGWDEQHIVAQRLDRAERHVVIKGAATVRYAPTGHLIYTRQGTVMAVRFDASRLEVTSAPIRLEDNIREGLPNADYDVAADGSLAYVEQNPAAYHRLPVLVDRKGRAQPLPGVAPARYNNPRFSPDGLKAVFEISGALSDLWVYDFTRASLTRLTTEGSSNFPVWSRDGKRIAYLATRSGSRNLFWKSIDGAAAEERLTTSEKVQIPWSWSPDGTELAFQEPGMNTGPDIWMLPLAGDRIAHPFLSEPFWEQQARFSPTGAWLAFTSNRSGRPEIYVQSYPEPSRRWQISTDGAQDPMWAGNGRELFYRSGDKVMSVAIAGGPTFQASTPRLLFAGDYARVPPPIDMDVHPDGQRFLMLQSSRPESPVTHINVVLNWFEELKRRLPIEE
jgi:serine/threonine-protein kinase